MAFDAALKETAPGVASAEMMMAFLFGGLGFLYVVFGVMYKKMHLT
ncbi:MAG TPA: hypothetical protein VFP46_00525 [Candidatus Paceibacterota bacterium]|nr:hypothetical protein [Candidatus Paceibacterota bacterium]